MKAMVAVCAGMVFVLNGHAQEIRNFTDLQGRVVSGSIVRYDGRKNLVTIRREGGQEATVPVGAFSEADRQYILAWGGLDAVRSTSKFLITIDRRRLESWSEEQLGTINYRGGGTAENQVVGKISYDKVGFRLELRNNNDVDLSGLEVEYCIYYEQELEDEGLQQGVLHGVLPVPLLATRGKLELMTDPVVVFKDEKNSEFTNARVLKGEVHGMALRVYGKNGEERVLLRQEALPDSVMKSYPWAKSSAPVAARKKKSKD